MKNLNEYQLICGSTHPVSQSTLAKRGFTFHILLFSLLLIYLPIAPAQRRDTDEIIEAAIHHQSLGLAYLEESKPSQAIEQFRELVNLVPDEAISYGNLAVAYLRLKKNVEAEAWIKRGLEVDPMNSQLHFILAEIYQWQGKTEEMAVEIQEAIKLAPNDLEARYKLVRLYLGQRNNPEAIDQAIVHLQTLRQQTPVNVVVLLNLAQALLDREQIAEAKRICSELNALLWDADKEALKFLRQGLLLIAEGEIKGAARQIRIFGNIQKITPRYQQGIGELVTNILGHPIETFSHGFRLRLKAKLSPPIKVCFADVTQQVGLSDLKGRRAEILLTDFDNDGNLDLYALPSRRNDSPVYDLLRNDGRKFVPTAKIAGYGTAAAFADLDKDGDPDLYLHGMADHDKFFRNEGSGEFTLFSETVREHSANGGKAVLFVDYDHDGDLDLFAAKNQVEIHRNNGDGTFSYIGDRSAFPPAGSTADDGAIGDFDDDGDIDLFVVNRGLGCTLYTNLRQGQMKPMTHETGISQDAPFTAVAIGDYDNDGDLDLFLTTTGETPHQLYRNRGDGSFALDMGSHEQVGTATEGVHGLDTHFLDYDNDGFLDLWLIGKPRAEDRRGVFLFRNDGTGRFADVSNLMPSTIRRGLQGTFGDYDSDGDLDLFMIDADACVIALNNEGGNQNGWLQVRLEGVNAGNNKNNIDGIGSKVEIKAGGLYQMRNVTQPLTHFGLGVTEQADVFRVVWTNGVPQNVILPRTNQRIREKQILKGSCPFLYIYDGQSYQFLTDLLWRSPLGMVTPMGFLAPTETADYVKIPGEIMKPKAGVYSLQITEELWETAYFDKVKLLVVDHPAGTEIFVDEKYAPPPFPGFTLYKARERYRLHSAFDHHGHDVSDALKAFDYRYAIPHEPGVFQGVVEPHFIVLDLGDVHNDQTVTLFLTGWVFPTDTSINVSLHQNPSVNLTFPYVQVRDRQGRWQTVIDTVGIPAGKNKTIAVNMTGKFLSSDRRVKIATNMQIYWDLAFFTIGGEDVPIQVNELSPHRAHLHYRGFSKMHRPTPHAPHMFDYNEVVEERQWRDLAGYYTRYGDVTPLLQQIDDMYVILNAGDEMTVEFDAAQLPPLKNGWVRDFVLFSDGWDKDGDINTLFSQTVAPLPFHGMSAYPYPDGESYPEDPGHLRYRLRYNTRRVTHSLPSLE